MYFVAIVCPPSINTGIQGCKIWMKEKFDCVVALRSPAHITLVPPFWLEQDRESALLEALYEYKSAMDEPEITINGFDHFSRRVLFAAVAKNGMLQKLKDEVEQHFRRRFPEIRSDQRPFHPHITIANRDMKPAHFLKAWEYFSKQRLHYRFTALTVSVLRHDGAQWQVIGESIWKIPKQK